MQILLQTLKVDKLMHSAGAKDQKVAVVVRSGGSAPRFLQ